MADEKVTPPEAAPAAEVPVPAKKKKLTDEEKYGGSGGKFDMSGGGRGGGPNRGPRNGKNGKGFIDPGRP